MKKFKQGFTLAEVLITLAIIGVVAAIVMPSVISSYQYKTIGTKLAKFASTTEGAARAYVASNDSFKIVDNGVDSSVLDFMNESYITKKIGNATTEAGKDSLSASFKEVTGKNDTSDNAEDTTANRFGGSAYMLGEDNNIETTPTTANVGLLKDNTYVAYGPITSSTTYEFVDASKTGNAVFVLYFDPMVSGLPSSVYHTFKFIITELGYIFPDSSDTCTTAIYNADWVTTAKMFESSSSSGCFTE